MYKYTYYIYIEYNYIILIIIKLINTLKYHKNYPQVQQEFRLIYVHVYIFYSIDLYNLIFCVLKNNNFNQNDLFVDIINFFFNVNFQKF